MDLLGMAVLIAFDGGGFFVEGERELGSLCVCLISANRNESCTVYNNLL